MATDFDVVIVGSGAGGSAAALSLARGGKRVLVVERGRPAADPAAWQDEERMLLRMEPYEAPELQINGRPARTFTAATPGGGTALYGAVLMRPGREDFVPGRHYGARLDRALHEWPVGYDELEPFFRQAEDLYHVAGDHEVKPPHIEARRDPYPGRPPALEPISSRLAEGMRKCGLRPFHLPLAIDFARCFRCPSCPGYICPNRSRASGLHRCLEPAVREHGAELWTGTRAERVLLNGTRAKGVALRRGRERIEVRAERVIVAGGALQSPALLMASGARDTSGQLGRNYMYHAGAMAVGLFAKPTGSSDRFTKQVGFTDLYLGDGRGSGKLGYAQALPIPGPRSMAANLPFPLPLGAGRWLHDRAVTLAGAVEDLPQPQNRVELTGNGLALHHRFHPYDVERSRRMAGVLTRVLRASGAVGAVGVTADRDDTHTAHQVGTCRFGEDPEHAVLDRDCRMHGYDNLYVLDGAFMPTSLGAPPALTIIANALRVGAKMLEGTT